MDSSPDSFFAGGSWKVWLLELQATPSGAEASLTLVAGRALEGHLGLPSLPGILGQHPLAHLRLTLSLST